MYVSTDAGNYYSLGQAETTLTVEIMPDDVPETDEEVTVQLYRVTPQATQRLRPGADRIKITIEENDNPGGTFEFSLAMLDSYTVEVHF